MKIAMLAWETLHSIPVGGVAVHVTELAAALHRRGHDVHIFCRVGNGQAKYDLKDGVHYHRCPIDIHPDFITEMNNMCNSFAWHMSEVERLMEFRFDLVHGHDWMTAKGIVQAKNNHGHRTVYTLHSTEYGRCGNNFFNGNCDRVRSVEAEGAFVADRVITVSGILADEVKWQYAIPEHKLRMVHNGITCERFDYDIDPGEIRRKYDVGPMDPMVLFVGRMSTQKGPDLLVEAIPGALACRGDAKFVFVGDGYMRGDLEHRTHDLGVSHACRFLGSMDADSGLLDLFKSTDVVCVPSRNEPFGIVILEAWAAGKPVIATHNGGPREFVAHGETGYLVYDHPGSVCWGVCEIFNNFAHAQWMGGQGKTTASSAFGWDIIAERTEGIYGELM